MLPTSDIGFVIGNGLSREGFELERLRGKGWTVGCNRIYRDFDPNFLVAIDSRPDNNMVAEIDAIPKPRPWQFLTRRYQHDRFWWLCCDDEPITRFRNVNHGWNLNSGLIGSYYLATVLRLKKVYILGLDFFLPVPGKDCNDIYGGNHSTIIGLVIAWNRLVKDNPQTEFIRVGPIAEHDREFYNIEPKGFTFMESFEGMPI